MISYLEREIWEQECNVAGQRSKFKMADEVEEKVLEVLLNRRHLFMVRRLLWFYVLDTSNLFLFVKLILNSFLTTGSHFQIKIDQRTACRDPKRST